jgi:outer membrane protein assembly factor BamB
LFIQADQGEPEAGESRLLALEARTGKTKWEVKRPVASSWSTPIVIQVAGQPQIITAGDPWLISYEPAAGTELWRARVLGGELAPSPVWAAGLILATSPGQALTAVRPDGAGDVTPSHVVWRTEQDVPDVPTPAATSDLFFTADSTGRVVCRETASGQTVWDHDFEVEFQASPLVTGDRLYLFAQPGRVFVVHAGRTFQQLGAFDMGDEVYASPAVSRGRLLVRTKQSLFCLGISPGVAGNPNGP